MLTLATKEPFWGGDALELSLSFDNLRDYQWDRLLKALWAAPGMAGPFETRYVPHAPEPAAIPLTTPEPTATYSLFGALEVLPGVRAGVEVWVTRSLFECVTLLLPLNMFESAEANSEERRTIEKTFFDLAVRLYEVTAYHIAVIGIDRGCQLMGELVSDNDTRRALLSQGNFLARDDILAALRLEPRNYQEVMSSLRWYPPK